MLPCSIVPGYTSFAALLSLQACYGFWRSGACPRAETCKCEHVRNPKPSSSAKKTPCSFWNTTGCKKGSACPYLHEGSGTNAAPASPRDTPRGGKGKRGRGKGGRRKPGAPAVIVHVPAAGAPRQRHKQLAARRLTDSFGKLATCSQLGSGNARSGTLGRVQGGVRLGGF